MINVFMGIKGQAITERAALANLECKITVAVRVLDLILISVEQWWWQYPWNRILDLVKDL